MPLRKVRTYRFERLSRPMCGKALPFRESTHLFSGRLGLPGVQAEAEPREKLTLVGKP
jgi:hypothetical protein